MSSAICPNCKEPKTPEGDVIKPGRCQPCRTIYNREYMRGRRSEMRRDPKAWAEKRANKGSAAWYDRDRQADSKEPRRLPGESRRQADRRRQRDIRLLAIKAYGGFCACCGEDRIEFLAIDHVFSDGAVDRKGKGSSTRFYYWLRRNDYPQGRYQVLCHNCNLAKAFYGTCPHVNIAKRLVLVA